MNIVEHGEITPKKSSKRGGKKSGFNKINKKEKPKVDSESESELGPL